MGIKPIGERVLLRPEKTQEKTESGIFIPEAAKEEKKEGIIVEVGEKEDKTEFPVKKGDKIIYGGYSNEEFEIDGEKYVIIKLNDILAKIE